MRRLHLRRRSLGTLVSVSELFIGVERSMVNIDVAAAFNPARCMGLMVAKNDMQYHYVHWLGPLAASITHGAIYHIVPPYVRGKPSRNAAAV
jgi:glycerol uptake facilitator-like aquaporin